MEDDFDFGSYAPSIQVNSRSGSMKKLARKTDKSPQPVDNKTTKKNNDFDQLDDLLNGDLMPKRTDTSQNKRNSTSQPKKINNSVDSFFDEPSITLNATSKITDKNQNSSYNLDLASTSMNFTGKIVQNDIIEEDFGFGPNYSKFTKDRSKSPINNQLKVPDQNALGIQNHASMRNMRPPLKRKDSQVGLGLGDRPSTNTLNLGLSLTEQRTQPVNKFSNNLGLSLNDQVDIKPSRSVNFGQKVTMENRSQNKMDTGLVLFGEQPVKKQTNLSHFNIESRNDSPINKRRSQISEMRIGESIMINDRHSQLYNHNQNASILRNQFEKKPFQQVDSHQKQSNYSFQKPSTKLVLPPKLSALNITEQQNRKLHDYQKQLQHLKQTYQRQLSYLQQALDKQITVNQETRDRLMRDADNMIEEQRRRSTRVHDDQIVRLKQMSEWQRCKMQDSYKFQVQNLKSTIGQYQQSSQNDRGPSNRGGYDQSDHKHKRQIQAMSEQLQLQKKLLIDREHHLTKRQLQLQEKQQQYNSKRRKQVECYRQQEKSLLEKENKLRSNILGEKRQIMDQKQKIAMQAANMQLDIMKRKQKLDLMIKQVQMQKQFVQNERHQVRVLNQQMMGRYKQKMNQLTSDKQRVSNLQADLIRKIRIIQLRAKQSNVPFSQTQQNTMAKQNNWIRERPGSTAGQKYDKMNQTLQRSDQVEKLANQKSLISSKINKTLIEQNQQKIKLDDYLASMNKINKTRHNNFV